jgi:hypothetical protein
VCSTSSAERNFSHSYEVLDPSKQTTSICSLKKNIMSEELVMLEFENEKKEDQQRVEDDDDEEEEEEEEEKGVEV